jgi:Zn-finger nucleic acid-binding protein
MYRNLNKVNMKCPSCDELLVMSDRLGVEIDYCPKCRGVWLDRGELDKIIERSSPTSQSQGSRIPDEKIRYRENEQRDYKDPYYGKKKKESFLEDLFDF